MVCLLYVSFVIFFVMNMEKEGGQEPEREGLVGLKPELPI